MLKAERMGRLYAIKALINKDGVAGPGHLNFKLETEILRRIENRQVPSHVESFSQNGVDYIVQEYIEGSPLSYLVDNGTRFSEAEVKDILSQLLLILNDLHSPRQKKNAVVHRDLRLSNLLFKGGEIYLVDFGLARFLDPAQFPCCPEAMEDRHSSDSGRGSPGRTELKLQKNPGIETYRLLRKEISPRSDLFGVGVVAVDLFTGWVEDDSLFALPWEDVLPLSTPFIIFLRRLLSREGGFETAPEAMAYLESI